VATSNHVVENAQQVMVSFTDGVPREARVSRTSRATDLAVLAVDGGVPAWLPPTDDAMSHVGEDVFTMGFPASSILGDEVKLSDGSVNAWSGPRGDASLFQVSIPVQPGNSGGPSLNDQGVVLGRSGIDCLDPSVSANYRQPSSECQLGGES
jgi:S1-C subfamily serine protease